MVSRRACYLCDNRSNLHRFPRNGAKDQWMKFCLLNDKDDTKNLYLCSDHFKPTCFVRQVHSHHSNGNRQMLQHPAVPTILYPSSRPSNFGKAIGLFSTNNDQSSTSMAGTSEENTVTTAVEVSRDQANNENDKISIEIKEESDGDCIENPQKLIKEENVDMNVDNPEPFIKLENFENDRPEFIKLENLEDILENPKSNKRIKEEHGDIYLQPFIKVENVENPEPVEENRVDFPSSGESCSDILMAFKPVNVIDNRKQQINGDKRKRKRFTFIGDFLPKDMDCPTRTRKFFHLANEKIKQCKTTIGVLKQENEKLKRVLKSLKHQLAEERKRHK